MEPVIQMTKAELDAYIAEGVKKGLAGLENDDNTRILKRVTERTAGVRLVDGKVVLGYKNLGSDNRPQYFYNKPDTIDKNKMILCTDLIVEGNEVIRGVDIEQFRREAELAICPIKKVDTHEWVINQGVVGAKKVEDSAFSATDLGYDVPVDNTGVARVYTVELPKDFGGPRLITIQESMVNIPRS